LDCHTQLVPSGYRHTLRVAPTSMVPDRVRIVSITLTLESPSLLHRRTAIRNLTRPCGPAWTGNAAHMRFCACSEHINRVILKCAHISFGAGTRPETPSQRVWPSGTKTSGPCSQWLEASYLYIPQHDSPVYFCDEAAICVASDCLYAGNRFLFRFGSD